MTDLDESEEEEIQAQDIVQIIREYSVQADYISQVTSDADQRSQLVTKSLEEAFASLLHFKQVGFIDFQSLTTEELGRLLKDFPIILKPLLLVCNVAGRALKRDLGLENIDTYKLHLSPDQAQTIARYIKPFLPEDLPLVTLILIDRVSFIDKEIRLFKGQWEKRVQDALKRFTQLKFKKDKFSDGNQRYELDAACKDGRRIKYGIDVKRVEARQDIHKRCDEIVNKAAKLKKVFPQAKFGAVIYYPFEDEHTRARERLSSPFIDAVEFAGESQESVDQAVRQLLISFGLSIEEGLI